MADIVCGELVAAAAEGPRATERFAAVTAAAVAGLAGATSSASLLAEFLDRCGLRGSGFRVWVRVGPQPALLAALPSTHSPARPPRPLPSTNPPTHPPTQTYRACAPRRLAGRLEAALIGSDTLAAHNLCLVAAHLVLCGAVRADLAYSLLNHLKDRWAGCWVGWGAAACTICATLNFCMQRAWHAAPVLPPAETAPAAAFFQHACRAAFPPRVACRFSEPDITALATLLRNCGLALRAADPSGMKVR